MIIKIISESEILKHGFNASFARFERSFELDFLTIKQNAAARALFNTRNLTHKG
jgi:hypothetical protein